MDQTSASTSDARAKIDAFLGVKPGARRRWPLVIALLAIGVALALLIWFLLRGAGDEPRYATSPVERGDLRVTVSATGNLAPTNKVEVGSELSGIVSAVYVDNNDRVTKGQILARLDTSRLEDTVRESEAALASAEASVAQAQATLTEARASLTRMEEVYRLSGGKAPSATELDVARAVAARRPVIWA